MITVFLTTDRSRRYTAVSGETDAIMRIKTATVARFTEPSTWGHPTPGTLDQIFAVCNGEGSHPKAEAEYRASTLRDDGLGCRSLSVGDIIQVPGYGLFACDPMGWKRLDHRRVAALTAAVA